MKMLPMAGVRAKLLAYACVVSAALSSVGQAAPILYAADASTTNDYKRNVLHTLDPTTGAATFVGPFNVDGLMASLAYDPTKDVLYGTTTASNNLYSINRSTGAATLIGSLGAELMHGLAFDPSTQTLYGTYGVSGGDGLYSIDTATGAAALVGHVGFFRADHLDRVVGLAVSPQTGDLYGSLGGSAGTGGLVRIDKVTGQGQLIGFFTPHIEGLAFEPATGMLYGVDNSNTRSLYTIDVTTAAARYVGSTGLANPLGLEFVPEPATLSLLVLGGLLLARRRRV
jgi:hypothetical protein